MITLESIKAEQDKLAGMIATLEARTKIAAAYPVTIELPQLAEGEIYLGAIIEPNGRCRQTILLPGDNDATEWQAQMDWAAGLGGDLPAQDELEILYRNLKPDAVENWCYARSGINLSALPPTRPYTPGHPVQTLLEAFREGPFVVRTPTKPARFTKKHASAHAAAMSAARQHGMAEVFALVPVGKAVRGAEWRPK